MNGPRFADRRIVQRVYEAVGGASLGLVETLATGAIADGTPREARAELATTFEDAGRVTRLTLTWNDEGEA